jgi:hypothetical protein
MQRYETFAYVTGERDPFYGVLDRLRKRILLLVEPLRVVIVGVGPKPVRVELFPVAPLRGVPVNIVVVLP